MSEYAHPDHKGAAKMLGFAMAARTFDGWRDFSDFAMLALSDEERASIAWAALRSLEPSHAEAVAENVLGAAGGPLPPFLQPLSDARFWASLANRRELKAYALAAFEALDIRDRAAFLAHVNVGRAAA